MEAVLQLDTSIRNSLLFLQNLLGNLHIGEIAVRLWDGTVWKNSHKPRCTLVLKHPGALRRMFWPPTRLSLSEAYVSGDFDIEGEIEEGLTLLEGVMEIPWGLGEKVRFGRFLWSLPARERSHAQQRGSWQLDGGSRADRQGIRFHYDLPNGFFRQWLDPKMVSSCAYFDTVEDGLEAAQERQLDYTCRKLRLHEGERLLDLGCGWGGLLLHAARNYGVEALGLTISPEQAEEARARIRKEGLEGRCRVEVRDFRNLQMPHCFDKIVSVDMFAHPGMKNLPEYFAQAWRLLRPGGRIVHHGIAESLGEPQPEGPSFAHRYLFPDSEHLSLTDSLRMAEMTGFEIRDVESLREHYTLTLRHWLRRLEQGQAEAVRLCGEVPYRIWRLYMADSARAFRLGRFNFYQTLLVKPEYGESGLPLTRTDWYH